jgi:hypothetical protein
MAKFSGTLGFVTVEESDVAGVFEEVVTEVTYTGDILRNARRWDDSQKVISDLTVENRFSIVADSFAIDNTPNMRYLKVFGARWKITSVEIQRPRIFITVGGVYNGPVAEKEEPPEEVEGG